MTDARESTVLLDLQFWCWGQDICHPDGNLLLRYGFGRVEPPRNERCASLYRLCLPSGGRLILRGFGVFFGEVGVGGVFLDRSAFQPLMTHHPDIGDGPWRPADLPPLHRPEPAELPGWLYLTGTLVRWIQHYEEWVRSTASCGYREEVVARWAARGRPCVPAARMVAAWREIARTLQDAPPPPRVVPGTMSATG